MPLPLQLLSTSTASFPLTLWTQPKRNISYVSLSSIPPPFKTRFCRNLKNMVFVFTSSLHFDSLSPLASQNIGFTSLGLATQNTYPFSQPVWLKKMKSLIPQLPKKYVLPESLRVMTKQFAGKRFPQLCDPKYVSHLSACVAQKTNTLIPQLHKITEHAVLFTQPPCHSSHGGD